MTQPDTDPGTEFDDIMDQTRMDQTREIPQLEDVNQDESGEDPSNWRT